MTTMRFVLPGGDETAAAVPTGPGEHRDRLRREQASGEVGEVAPGVLHHLDELDVEVLDHGAIHGSHLGDIDPRDDLAAGKNEPTVVIAPFVLADRQG